MLSSDNFGRPKSTALLNYDTSLTRLISNDRLSESDADGNLVTSIVSVTPPDLVTLASNELQVKHSMKRLRQYDYQLGYLLNLSPDLFPASLVKNIMTGVSTHVYNLFLNRAAAAIQNNIKVTTNTPRSQLLSQEELNFYYDLVGKVKLGMDRQMIPQPNNPETFYQSLQNNIKHIATHSLTTESSNVAITGVEQVSYGALRENVQVNDSVLEGAMAIQHENGAVDAILTAEVIAISIVEKLSEDPEAMNQLQTMIKESKGGKSAYDEDTLTLQRKVMRLDDWDINQDLNIPELAHKSAKLSGFIEGQQYRILDPNIGTVPKASGFNFTPEAENDGLIMEQQIYVKGFPYAYVPAIEESRKNLTTFEGTVVEELFPKVTIALDPMTRSILTVWNMAAVNAQWLKFQKEAIMRRPEEFDDIVPKGNMLNYHTFTSYDEDGSRASSVTTSIDMYKYLVLDNIERMNSNQGNMLDYDKFATKFLTPVYNYFKPNGDSNFGFNMKNDASMINTNYGAKYVQMMNMISTRPKILFTAITSSLEIYDIADSIRYINIAAALPQYQVASNPYYSSSAGNSFNPYLLTIIAGDMEIDNGLVDFDNYLQVDPNTIEDPQKLLAKVMSGSSFNYLLYFEVVACRDYMTNAEARFKAYNYLFMDQKVEIPVLTVASQDLALENFFKIFTDAAFVKSNNLEKRVYTYINDIGFGPIWYYKHSNGKTLFEMCLLHFNNDHNQFLNYLISINSPGFNYNFEESCSKYLDVPHSLKLIYLSFTGITYISDLNAEALEQLVTLIYGLNKTVVDVDLKVIYCLKLIVGHPTFHSFINYFITDMSYVNLMRMINDITPEYGASLTDHKFHPTSNCFIPTTLQESAVLEQNHIHYCHNNIAVLPCCTDDMTLTVYYETDDNKKRVQLSTNKNVGYERLLQYNLACLPVKFNFGTNLKVYRNLVNSMISMESIKGIIRNPSQYKKSVSSHVLHSKRLSIFNANIDIQFLVNVPNIESNTRRLTDFIKGNLQAFGTPLKNDMYEAIREKKNRLANLPKTSDINVQLQVQQLESEISADEQKMREIQQNQNALVESYKQEKAHGKRSILDDMDVMEKLMDGLIQELKNIEEEDVSNSMNDENVDDVITESASLQQQKFANIGPIQDKLKKGIKNYKALLKEYSDSADHDAKTVNTMKNKLGALNDRVSQAINTIKNFTLHNNDIIQKAEQRVKAVKQKQSWKDVRNKVRGQQGGNATDVTNQAADKETLMKLRQTIDTLRDQKNELENSKANLKFQLDEASRKVLANAKLAKQQSDTVNEAALIISQANETYRLRLVNCTFTEQIQAMKEIIKELEGESLMYKNQAIDAENRNKAIAEEAQTVTAQTRHELEQMRLKHDHLHERNVQFKSINEALNKEVEKYRDELSSKDKELLQVNEKIKLSEKDKALLQSKIDEIEMNMNLKNGEFNTSVAEIKRLQLEMKKIENATDLDKKALEEYKNFVEHMKSLTKGLRDSISFKIGSKAYVNAKQARWLNHMIEEMQKNSKFELHGFDNIIIKLNSNEEDIEAAYQDFINKQNNLSNQLELLTKEKNMVSDKFSELIVELTGQAFGNELNLAYYTIVKKLKLSKENEDSLTEQVKGFQKTRREAQENFQNQINSLSALKMDKQRLEELKQTQENTLRDLENQLATAKSEAKQQLKELQESRKEIEDLKNQMLEKQNEIKKGLADLSNVNELRRQISELTLANDNLVTFEHGGKKVDKKGFEESVKKAAEENAKKGYEETIFKLNSELTNAKIFKDNMLEANAKIASDLDEATTNLAKAMSEQETLNAAKATLDTELQVAKSLLEQNKKAAIDNISTKPVPSNQHILKEMKSDNDILKKAKKDLENDKIELDKMIQAKKTEVENLTIKLQDSDNNLNNAKKANSLADQKIKQLQEDLNTAQSIIGQGVSKHEYNDLMIEKNKLQSDNERLKQANKTASNQKVFDDDARRQDIETIRRNQERINELEVALRNSQESAEDVNNPFSLTSMSNQLTKVNSDYQSFKLLSEQEHNRQLDEIAKQYNLDRETLINQGREVIMKVQSDLDTKLDELEQVKQFLQDTRVDSMEEDSYRQRFDELTEETNNLRQEIEMNRQTVEQNVAQLHLDYQEEIKNLNATIHNIQEDRNAKVRDIEGFKQDFKNYINLIASSTRQTYSLNELEEYLARGASITNTLEGEIRRLIDELNGLKHQVHNFNVNQNAEGAILPVNDNDLYTNQINFPSEKDPNLDPTRQNQGGWVSSAQRIDFTPIIDISQQQGVGISPKPPITDNSMVDDEVDDATRDAEYYAKIPKLMDDIISLRKSQEYRQRKPVGFAGVRYKKIIPAGVGNDPVLTDPNVLFQFEGWPNGPYPTREKIYSNRVLSQNSERYVGTITIPPNFAPLNPDEDDKQDEPGYGVSKYGKYPGGFTDITNSPMIPEGVDRLYDDNYLFTFKGWALGPYPTRLHIWRDRVDRNETDPRKMPDNFAIWNPDKDDNPRRPGYGMRIRKPDIIIASDIMEEAYQQKVKYPDYPSYPSGGGSSTVQPPQRPPNQFTKSNPPPPPPPSGQSWVNPYLKPNQPRNPTPSSTFTKPNPPPTPPPPPPSGQWVNPYLKPSQPRNPPRVSSTKPNPPPPPPPSRGSFTGQQIPRQPTFNFGQTGNQPPPPPPPQYPSGNPSQNVDNSKPSNNGSDFSNFLDGIVDGTINPETVIQSSPPIIQTPVQRPPLQRPPLQTRPVVPVRNPIASSSKSGYSKKATLPKKNRNTYYEEDEDCCDYDCCPPVPCQPAPSYKRKSRKDFCCDECFEGKECASTKVNKKKKKKVQYCC